MSRVNTKVLLISFLFFLQTSVSVAKVTDGAYAVQFRKSGDSIRMQFISCQDSILPQFIVYGAVTSEFEEVKTIDSCTLYEARLRDYASTGALVISNSGELSVVKYEASIGGGWLGSPEIRSVLIFIGGLIAASLARLLSLFLDPVRHTIVACMKFRATKNLVRSKSDSFAKDINVSEDLKRISEGEYLTNFLLRNRFRVRIGALLHLIEEWKQGNVKPEELREKLSKI